MKTTTLYDKLLKYMYDEYDNGQNAHGYGEHLQVLISHYQRSSGNRIGDAHDQRAAVAYFLRNGWIEAVDTNGNIINDSLSAYTYGRMQPSERGREYLRQRRVNIANSIASVLGTFFGNLFKSLFGK